MIDARRVLCGFALALSMCGGAQREPAAAPGGAPAPSLPPGYPAPAAPSAPEAPPAASPAAAPPVREGPAEPAQSRATQRAVARDELARAEGSLEASASDCAAACRALASMGRAVGHLCALVDSPDDQRRCDDAKQRLANARERVRQACGTCSP